MFAETITATLPELRTLAESRMLDVCLIERASGATWNETTGQSVVTWTTVVADLPCRITDTPAGARELAAAETVTSESPEIRVPASTVGILPDDRITFTSTVDPDHLGAVLWVTHVRPHTQGISRRIRCRRHQ